MEYFFGNTFVDTQIENAQNFKVNELKMSEKKHKWLKEKKYGKRFEY